VIRNLGHRDLPNVGVHLSASATSSQRAGTVLKS
jgi:hypothetical protein